MLTRLRHRPISSRHHQNRAIHLRRTRNHVLDIIRVPRHIHMRIMTILSHILHMRHIDRDPTLTLLRSLINIVVRRRLITRNPISQRPRNRRSQRRLPMVNMTHRPHVHMRLVPLELLLGHEGCSPNSCGVRVVGVAWVCGGDGRGRTDDLSIMSRAL